MKNRNCGHRTRRRSHFLTVHQSEIIHVHDTLTIVVRTKALIFVTNYLLLTDFKILNAFNKCLYMIHTLVMDNNSILLIEYIYIYIYMAV